MTEGLEEACARGRQDIPVGTIAFTLHRSLECNVPSGQRGAIHRRRKERRERV